MNSIFSKLISAVAAASLLFGAVSAAIPIGAKAEARKIIARHYDGITVDGEIDEAWEYAEKADISAKVGSTPLTAGLRALYGDYGINYADGKNNPNKVLYLLVEVDKHGKSVTNDDAVYISIDMTCSGQTTSLTTAFGVGIVGVTPVGEALNFGWLSEYRGNEFYSAAKKIADDKWVAEIAIDIVDANRTTRPYEHIENGQTVADFGKGTEIGLSVIACEHSKTFFAENNTVAWGSDSKRDFLIPKNKIVIGNSITELPAVRKKSGNTTGDVNGDGKIKGNDATLLLKYLADWNVTVDDTKSDCNGDEKIKGNDATLLLKYLADWNVELAMLPFEGFGNMIIFGDSISTFDGWIPEENPAYYPLYLVEEYNITTVEQTWWHMLLSETSSTLVRNDSYSGSCICYTSYGQTYDKEASFLYRFDHLVETGYFNENHIDTIMIFGGTNDWAAEVPVGDVKYSDISEKELESALPATSTMLSHMREALPNARIVLIISDRFEGELGYQYARIGKHYGANVVMLPDIEHYGLHPTESGMCQIKDAVLECFA